MISVQLQHKFYDNIKEVIMDNKQFGEKLKLARKAKGFTQEVLAEKADIDPKHLSRIENGKFFPTFITLNRLLDALDLSLSEIGLTMEKLDINANPLYIKSLQILNSAEDDIQLEFYLESLQHTQKIIKNSFTHAH